MVAWEDGIVRRRNRGRYGIQLCLISFGIGLLSCFLFPSKLVIIILGIALILCGLCDRR